MKIKCEIYSRVSGYYNPISQWNKGKKSEYSDRKYINIKEYITEYELDKAIS